MHQRTLAAFRELGEMTPGSCWLGALTALASFPAIASVSAEVLRKTQHLHRDTPYCKIHFLQQPSSHFGDFEKCRFPG